MISIPFPSQRIMLWVRLFVALRQMMASNNSGVEVCGGWGKQSLILGPYRAGR